MGSSFFGASFCWLFNAFCPQPAPLFSYAFGRVFFWMLVFANIFVILLVVSVVGGLCMRLRSPAWWLSRTWTNASSAQSAFARISKEGLGKAPVTVLVPCYLPNEQHILDGTIAHIMERLEYGHPFDLLVCYNTPHPLEYEKKLAARDGTVYPNGRTLRILKVDGSTSKAQNLNAALQQVKTERLVIYDADHFPDPDSLLIASAHMEAHDCSCVQGSTYLRHRPNLLSFYINAEFFVTHFVFFPAMEFVAGAGVFGGSNALWRTADLRAYEFRHDVQTEDIELSTRAMLSGRVRTCSARRRRVTPCPLASSG